jgi:hypothetical protein
MNVGSVRESTRQFGIMQQKNAAHAGNNSFREYEFYLIYGYKSNEWL